MVLESDLHELGVTRAQVDRWAAFQLRATLSQLPGWRPCLTGDCPFGVVWQDNDPPDFKCTLCDKGWCARCKTAQHPGASCEKNMAAVQAENSLLSFNVRPCPNCGVPTERISGCDFMKCRVCKASWIWGSDSGLGNLYAKQPRTKGEWKRIFRLGVMASATVAGSIYLYSKQEYTRSTLLAIISASTLAEVTVRGEGALYSSHGTVVPAVYALMEMWLLSSKLISTGIPISVVVYPLFACDFIIKSAAVGLSAVFVWSQFFG